MQGVNAFALSAAVDPYTTLSTEQSESDGSVIPQWTNYKKAAVDSGKAAETSLSTSRSASSGSRQVPFSGSNP